MRSFLATLFYIIIALSATSQTIPSDRLVDWSQAGYVGQKHEPSRVIDFTKAGGITDGTTANDASFTTLLNSITDSAVIYFPPGKYFFTKPLILKSNIIIRGAGNDSTELIFDLIQERHLIQSIGRKENIKTTTVADALKGANTIEVLDATAFQAGDFILLGDNDSAVVTSTWAYGSTGQIIEISSIQGNVITLNGMLRRDYLLAKNPKITKLMPVTNIGIESLKITRLDATVQQTSNIHFWLAANCWVKCVESAQCNFAHVELSHSSHITVSGSYFHGAHAYGGGGQGYGVILQYNTGDCLVQENIFDTLRHSMLLQAGANGNVLAYNYSDHPFWTQSFLPANSAGDLVLHGNHAYANLFEGNTVQHIVIDNSHGKNGPYNTFFRNRANGYGFFMNTGPATDNQNMVGNEITNTGSLMGLYTLAGNGHLLYGNNHKGTIKPANTTTIPEASLYLDSLSSYYNAKHIAPPIGLPNVIGANIIETQLRYQERTLTECTRVVWQPEPQDTVIEEPVDTTIEEPGDTTIEEPIDTTIIEEPIDTNTATAIGEVDKPSAQLYPNPATDYLTIQLPTTAVNAEVRLFDLSGREVIGYTFTAQRYTLDVSMLQLGLYFYELQFDGQVQRGKVVVE